MSLACIQELNDKRFIFLTNGNKIDVIGIYNLKLIQGFFNISRKFHFVDRVKWKSIRNSKYLVSHQNQ